MLQNKSGQNIINKLNQKYAMNNNRVSIIWLLLFVIFSFTCNTSSAQGFKVKEFHQVINDGSAFHAPIDEAGHPCGLIKVRTNDAGLTFKGSVVGQVENKTNEYWVYMAQGSSLLHILHPNFLPMLINFNDYGIGEVTSKATYILALSELKYNKVKSGLVATVKPETAALYIDDVFIENLSGNGLYQLYLPKGDHICRIEQKGYRPNVQVVATGKGTQNLNVELESVMAELDVKCKTGTAEIYIDGELKGNGSWKGPIFAGEHQIEARQQNFETNTQTISIAEKENRTVVVPELKRSMGRIFIETNPSMIPVEVDGKKVGLSPCIIDIESGNHHVSCKAFGFLPYRSDFTVASTQNSTIKIKMKIDESNVKEWQELRTQAYEGKIESAKEIVRNLLGLINSGRAYNMEREYSQEIDFWRERYLHVEDIIKWYERTFY